MTKLESVNWGTQTVHMKIRGFLSVPDSLSSPTRLEPLSPSPTESPDSAFASRPSSLMPWSLHKYLIHGGPGFSIGILDSTTGNVDHVPVPVPSLSNTENPSCDCFSFSEVSCMVVAGESQVWVGTEGGSLHVFDLTSTLRLSTHLYTNLTDPILCIATRQRAEGTNLQDLRTEVLLGSPSGTVTIISRKMDERGGLKNPLKGLRKLIQLGNGEEGCSVDCIVHVNCSGNETYWCSCGRDIVILSRSNWKEIGRIDGTLSEQTQPYCDGSHITHLVNSECGVWSCCSHSSTLLLWDTNQVEQKLKLQVTCCNYCTTDGWVDDFAQITALSFAYPQLFVGTNGGHLLVFKVLDDLPVNRRDSVSKAATMASNRTKPAIEYKLLAATHCGPVQIIGIHPIPVRGDFSCRSPFESPLGTPSSSMQVLLVCRGKVTDREAVSSSQVQLYELYAASPRASVLVSPLSCRSDTCSLSSSLSSRRGSVSRSLPKLTLHSVSENTLTYLPLKDSD